MCLISFRFPFPLLIFPPFSFYVFVALSVYSHVRDLQSNHWERVKRMEPGEYFYAVAFEQPATSSHLKRNVCNCTLNDTILLFSSISFSYVVAWLVKRLQDFVVELYDVGGPCK